MDVNITANFLGLEPVTFKDNEGNLQEMTALHLFEGFTEHVIYLANNNPYLSDYEALEVGDEITVPCRLVKSGKWYKLKHRNI